MGGPAKKLNPETGKAMAVPGVQIFVGGRIGEDAPLTLPLPLPSSNPYP